jgi:RNA polymerase sporulation-specific sigma factor
LVLRARSGDELAFRRLLDRHRDLIGWSVRMYGGKGLARQDYEQEALIGLHKAVRDYRADRESSFRNFAALCIKRQVITALKTATRRKHEPLNEAASLDAPLPADPDGSLGDLVSDRRSTVPDPVEHVEQVESLHELSVAIRERLTDVEYACLRLWAGGGLEYQDIAGRLGVGEKTVDNALQRVQRKLGEDDPPGSPRHHLRAYGFRCPTCGGPTVKVKRRGRPPRCVVCRSNDTRQVAA